MHEAALANTIALRLRESRQAGVVGRPRLIVRGGHDESAAFDAALRLLDRKDFRLIRSSGDLLEAIRAALVEIQAEAGHDLPLLYSAPRKSTKSKPAWGKAERPHLHENALQAYLRRRLKDVLGRMADGVDVRISREEQVGYRRRYDLHVTAPSLGSRRSAAVVIEVKWSTNPETRTSLVDQLGRKYLLEENQTHGVFLVGWSEYWEPGGGRGKVTDIDDLRRALAAQRDEFCAAGAEGHGLEIEPVVLDLGWRKADGLRSPGR